MELIKVNVGRIGSTKTVEVSNDTTISEALTIGGFGKQAHDTIRNLANRVVIGSDPVSEGQSYYYVEAVKDGKQ